MHTYTHTDIQTYTHTHIHTGTQTHTLSAAATNTATWSRSLQHTATHCNTLQHTATHCNTLQHTATSCSTLRIQQVGVGRDAVLVEDHDKMYSLITRILSQITVLCVLYIYACLRMLVTSCCRLVVRGTPSKLSTSVLSVVYSDPNTATHCNTRQHTATHCTHCNTLQHITTHSSVVYSDPNSSGEYGKVGGNTEGTLLWLDRMVTLSAYCEMTILLGFELMRTTCISRIDR